MAFRTLSNFRFSFFPKEGGQGARKWSIGCGVKEEWGREFENESWENIIFFCFFFFMH